jgi:hypothetical protein
MAESRIDVPGGKIGRILEGDLLTTRRTKSLLSLIMGRTLKTLPTRDWSCILPSPKAGGPLIHLALAAEGALDEKI